MSMVFITATLLQLTEFDQLKLAHFMEKLPSAVHTEISLDSGRKITSVLEREAFSISCESNYFGEPHVPSSSSCAVSIDINHPAVEKGYDEIRIKEFDANMVHAFYSMMTGKETRYYRSAEFEIGTDFSGRRTNIFAYLFSCTQSECSFKFSEKKLQ